MTQITKQIRILVCLCLLLALAVPALAAVIQQPEGFGAPYTFPPYQALPFRFHTEMDMSQLNTSGIKEKKGHTILFQDGSEAQAGDTGLSYTEAAGTWNWGSDAAPQLMPKPSLAAQAGSLATVAAQGISGFFDPLALENTVLSTLSLEQAAQIAQEFLQQAGMSDLVLSKALDMSLARIQEVGARINDAVLVGKYMPGGPNEYSLCTEKEQGYLLTFHHKLMKNSRAFTAPEATVYVTQDGIKTLSARNIYAFGEALPAVKTLFSAQTIQTLMAEDVRTAFGKFDVQEIKTMDFLYAYLNDETLGPILTPAWQVVFTGNTDSQEGELWAIYDARDGKRIASAFDF